MDMLSLLRTLGGLGTVLGILAGALWIVRRYDLRLPGRAINVRDRRLELVETLSIDARRVVALVRRDGREHLLLIAPEGHLVLETALLRDDVDRASEDTRRAEREAKAAARASVRPAEVPKWPVEGFGVLADRARGLSERVWIKLNALCGHTMRTSVRIWRSASAHQPASFREFLAAAPERIHPAPIREWPFGRFRSLVNHIRACAGLRGRPPKALSDCATPASVEPPLAPPLDPTPAHETKHVRKPSTVRRIPARNPARASRTIAPETNLA